MCKEFIKNEVTLEENLITLVKEYIILVKGKYNVITGVKHKSVYYNESLNRRIYDSIKDTKDLEEIWDILSKNVWTDLFVSLSIKFPKYYREYINKNKITLVNKITNFIFQSIRYSKNIMEEFYINNSTLDLKSVDNDTNKVSSFWIARNYYKVIKNVDSDMANEIWSAAISTYNNFLLDTQLIQNSTNIKETYDKMLTTQGKINLLQLIWDSSKLVNGQINCLPMTKYIEDIKYCADKSLSENNLPVFSTLIYIILMIINIDWSASETFKSEIISLLESYKNNSIAKRAITIIS